MSVFLLNSLYSHHHHHHCHVRTVEVMPQVPSPWRSEPQRTRLPRVSRTAPTLPSSPSCFPSSTAALGPRATQLPGLRVRRLRAQNKEEHKKTLGSKRFIIVMAKANEDYGGFHKGSEKPEAEIKTLGAETRRKRNITLRQV